MWTFIGSATEHQHILLYRLHFLILAEYQTRASENGERRRSSGTGCESTEFEETFASEVVDYGQGTWTIGAENFI